MSVYTTSLARGLILLLACLKQTHASTTTCTTEQATELGCDAIVSPATHGGGHPDFIGLDGSFVDYSGQTLCIPAGEYSGLAINYVEGTASNPIVVTNCGGIVYFDGRNAGLQGTGHWDTISGKGVKHLRLTGSGLLSYADGGSKYGIVAHHSVSHGVHFDEGSSHITVDHVETHDNGDGGVVIRTYPRCDGRCGHVPANPSYNLYCSRGNFVQTDTVIHNNYIHDLEGEGMYIGTSHFHLDSDAAVYDPSASCPGQTQAQAELHGVEIYSNRLEDIGLDAIQVGSATQDVQVYSNTIRNFASKQEYGHAHAIAFNPGSTGTAYNNYIKGQREDRSNGEYFGIVYHGQGVDNPQLSRVYNNVILHTHVPFMFLNKEESVGQEYEFVHNTIYDFTGTGPLKMYCLSTVENEVHPTAIITVRNNIFAFGSNSTIYDSNGFQEFYGNTNGVDGLDCLDYTDTFRTNIFELHENASTVSFKDLPYDFHLKETSPFIGVGVALSNGPVVEDFDGLVRSAADFGAYSSWASGSITDDDLFNPERGFYHHTQSLASSPEPLNLSVLQSVRAGGRTVLLRVYYLDDFLDTDTLSPKFLSELSQDFETMLAAGMKCVLRFAYYLPSVWPDNSCCPVGTTTGSTCCQTEPEVSRILAHIAALSTTLQTYANAIIAVQSGFIGPWGEGHASPKFGCSSASDSKRQIVEALIDAVPGKTVQIRIPKLKMDMYYPELESDMTSIATNLVSNPDFETTDINSPTGLSTWGVGVGTPVGSEVTATSADAISGAKSVRVEAGFSALQAVPLSAEQGQAGNIIKIAASSRLHNPPPVMPNEDDYSVYADIAFTSGDPMWGKTATFCGSGDVEFASMYIEVPEGRTMSSISIHLIYRNVASGYAVFDDVSVSVFGPYDIARDPYDDDANSYLPYVGHHNDCFLATDTDWGTFTSGSVDEEKSYLAKDTAVTSMGGETCRLNPPRSDCPTALAELSQFHYSYMNEDYHEDVIAGWSSGGCLDGISSKLGYKLIVTATDISSSVVPGGYVTYSLTVKNVGYAKPLHNRRFSLKFVSDELNCEMVDASVDIRLWRPSDSDTYTVSGVASLPDMVVEGTFAVYLDLADEDDDLADSIMFKTGLANDGLYNTAVGLNSLRHSITVTPSSSQQSPVSSNPVTCSRLRPPVTGSPTKSPTKAPSHGPTMTPTVTPTNTSTSAPVITIPMDLIFYHIHTNFGVKTVGVDDDDMISIFTIGKGLDVDMFLFQKDCSTEVSKSLYTRTETREDLSATHQTLIVYYNFVMEEISSSSIWNETSSTIEVCQTAKLMVDGGAEYGELVIKEDTRIVEIEFDLTTEFNITSSELTGATIDTLDEYAGVDGAIHACKCGGLENYTCNTDELTPNEALYVCISTVEPTFEIENLESMMIIQGQTQMDIVKSGAVRPELANGIADRRQKPDDTGVAVTTLIPINLFDFQAGASVSVIGQINMKLASKRSELFGRSLRANPARLEYEVFVDLKDSDPEVSNSAQLDSEFHALYEVPAFDSAYVLSGNVLTILAFGIGAALL